MNKFNIPDPSNGVKLFWEDLEYTLGYGAYDGGLLQGIEGILKAYGDDFIVSGCADLGSSVTAAGWVMLGGTLIKVDQHTRTNTYFVATTETNTTGDRTDNLGGSVNIYIQNRAKCTGASGNLAYDGIRLDEILGLNITTRAITTNGTYNIANNEKWITIVSSTSSLTTVNLPTPSTYNKGSLYNVFLTYTGTGTLNIVGESGNLKNYPGVSASGIVGFMNDGTNWKQVYEKITSTKDVPGIIQLANPVTDYKILTNTTKAMTAEDVGNAMRSDYVEYTTSGTKSPEHTVGVIKVSTTNVTINISPDSNKKQELYLYIGDNSSTPADCIINYSDDGLSWSLLLDINIVADNKLYHFVSDGTTWRWTIHDYVEQT